MRRPRLPNAATPPAADPCAPGSGERLLHVPSPDWRDQVVYMIFTDRFHDGDPANNDMGEGEFDANSPGHFNGGDFQGMIDKIPYLQELGITAIWQTPPVLNQWWSTPYAAAGWHGYWAVNFKEVDPHFGTLDGPRDGSEPSHQLGSQGNAGRLRHSAALQGNLPSGITHLSTEMMPMKQLQASSRQVSQPQKKRHFRTFHVAGDAA